MYRHEASDSFVLFLKGQRCEQEITKLHFFSCKSLLNIFRRKRVISQIHSTLLLAKPGFVVILLAPHESAGNETLELGCYLQVRRTIALYPKAYRHVLLPDCLSDHFINKI